MIEVRYTHSNNISYLHCGQENSPCAEPKTLHPVRSIQRLVVLLPLVDVFNRDSHLPNTNGRGAFVYVGSWTTYEGVMRPPPLPPPLDLFPHALSRILVKQNFFTWQNMFQPAHAAQCPPTFTCSRLINFRNKKYVTIHTTADQHLAFVSRDVGAEKSTLKLIVESTSDLNQCQCRQYVGNLSKHSVVSVTKDPKAAIFTWKQSSECRLQNTIAHGLPFL